MKKLVSLLTVAALLFGGVVFAQNDTKKEEKVYRLPSLDILFMAKVGTVLTFSGDGWKQTVTFNSGSAQAVTKGPGSYSSKEKWKYWDCH